MLPGVPQLPGNQPPPCAGLRAPRASGAPWSWVSSALPFSSIGLSPSFEAILVQLAHGGEVPCGTSQGSGECQAPGDFFLAAHSSLIPWQCVWCVAPRLGCPGPSSQAYRKSPHSPNHKAHQGRQSPCLVTGGRPEQALLSYISVCWGPEQACIQARPLDHQGASGEADAWVGDGDAAAQSWLQSSPSQHCLSVPFLPFI